ncbi:MAG TPA: hypothetical protein VGX68_03320 [Thermoanaerobaculia bacterium]|jgi:hypothetical protein|nr:hypothetical protein [Thermoanaerobaculia bacterium]
MNLLLRALLCGLALLPAASAQPPSAPAEVEGMTSAPLPPNADEAALKNKFIVDYRNRSGQRNQVYREYLETLGTPGILDALEALNPYCHNEAHELGRAVFSQRKDLGRALAECGSRCSSGCLHGVLKEAFGNSTMEEIKPRLPSVCTQGAMADIQRPGNCAHGMGHALMLILGNDVEKAIAGCAGFGDDAMAYYCVTGVYMELFDHAGEWAAKETGPFYPCDVYTRFPAACYRYQAPRMLKRLGDRTKVAELCRTLPAAQRLGCFHGFGFANLYAVSQQPDLISSLCPETPAEEQTVCLEGAIESLAAFNPVRASFLCLSLKDRAAEICKAAAQEGTYRLRKPSLPLYLGR